MTKRLIAIICGTALLIAAVVVVALRERLQPVPLPEVPVAQTPADVRVEAVEWKTEPVESIDIDAAKFWSNKQMRTSMVFGTLSPEAR